MNWSPQQQHAIDAAGHWIRDRYAPVFRLFGYAGTGKSTLVRHLTDGLDGRVAYGAYTGKAALVMRRNGCPEATTLHSLLYSAATDDRGHTTWTVNREGAAAKAELIVVDEVSMVGPQMGEDLLSLGVPILVIGDPAQLPPVDRGADAGGFFTAAGPDVMLTEIHRQARDNPIIAMATDVREGRPLKVGRFGTSAVVRRPDPAELKADVLAADQVLVGRNATRQAYNARIRTLLGRRGSLPAEGDKLVCLKNNRGRGLLNGGLWRVHQAAPPAADSREVTLLVDPDDTGELERREVAVPREFFVGGHEDLPWQYLRHVDQMTFGYALTVHKSQGSQWPRTVVFDESGVFRESAKAWLYTALTRASERVTVVAA